MSAAEGFTWHHHHPDPPSAILCELTAIRESLSVLHRKVDTVMSDQSQLDQTAANIETDVQAINSGVQNVQAEIAQLQQANPSLDFSGVNSALNDLASATSGVTAAGAEVPPPAAPSA